MTTNPDLEKIQKELFNSLHNKLVPLRFKDIDIDIDRTFTQIQSLFSERCRPDTCDVFKRAIQDKSEQQKEIEVVRSEVYTAMNEALKEKDAEIRTLKAQAGKEWRKGYDFCKAEQQKEIERLTNKNIELGNKIAEFETDFRG